MSWPSPRTICSPEGSGSPMTKGTPTRPAAPTAGWVASDWNRILPITLLNGASSNKGAVAAPIAPVARACLTV
jgi:hypothetical protein